MLPVLLLLFIVLPIMEFAILSQISQSMGLLPTVGLVFLTGVLGAALARQQGLQTLWRLQQGMGGKNPPTDILLDGAMILVAGAVLITPGILTDLFGFALLAPPIRAIIKPLLRAWFARRVKVEVGRKASGFQFFGNQGFSQHGTGPSPFGQHDDVVEGEVVEEAPPQTSSSKGEVLEIRSVTKENKRSE